MQNSKIVYVPDAGPSNANKGDFFTEKGHSGNTNVNPTAADPGSMEKINPLQVQLSNPSNISPDFKVTSFQAPPTITNINGGSIGFNGGSSALTSAANGPIQRIANMLTNDATLSLTVVGSALMRPTDLGTTQVPIAAAPITYNQLKLNRANSVRNVLNGMNPSFAPRINTAITPRGSNAQTIMFQIAKPNPVPIRFMLQKIN